MSERFCLPKKLSLENQGDSKAGLTFKAQLQIVKEITGPKKNQLRIWKGSDRIFKEWIGI